MPKKVREMMRLVEEDGWVEVGQKGSHRQYKHPQKPGRVTIAGHPGDDTPIGIERSILRQAQISKHKEPEQ